MLKLENYIEHTLLKQDAKKEDFIKLFEEAKNHGFKGVCINPLYVSFAKKYLENTNIKIVTVVGFPLGANRTDVKAYETSKAVEDGADEIDMVINVTKIKDNDWAFVKEDIAMVKKACLDKPLKVILETDLLTQEEIKKACEVCIEAKADFVKTSTGFVKNGIGATVENVELMAKTVKQHGLGVKASAGVRDKEKAVAVINAGADRIGTSSGVSIVS